MNGASSRTSPLTQAPPPAAWDLNRLVRPATVAGALGALLLLVADVLGPHPATLGAVGLMEIPSWSLRVGGWLGILAAPLLVAYGLALYRGLRPAGFYWAVVPAALQAAGAILSLATRFGYLYFAALGEAYLATPIIVQQPVAAAANAAYVRVYDNLALSLLIALPPVLGLAGQAAGILLHRTIFPRWLGWLVAAQAVLILLPGSLLRDAAARPLALVISLIVARAVWRVSQTSEVSEDFGSLARSPVNRQSGT